MPAMKRPAGVGGSVAKRPAAAETAVMPSVEADVPVDVGGMTPAAEPIVSVRKSVSDETKDKGHCKTVLNQWTQSGNPEIRRQGQTLGKMYNSFSSEMKAEFAKKFLATKNTKDFAWVRELEENLLTKNTETGACIQDYFNRTQILKFNGFDMTDFTTMEHAMSLADEIIAIQRFELQGIAELHPDKLHEMPQLSQFWYVKSEGMRCTWATERLSQMKLSTNLNAKQAGAIVSGEPSSAVLDKLLEIKYFDNKDKDAATKIKDEYPKLTKLEADLQAAELRQPILAIYYSAFLLSLRAQSDLLPEPLGSASFHEPIWFIDPFAFFSI